MKKPCLNAHIYVLGLAVFSLFAFGCAAHTITVEIPPKIDLKPYQTIGIVEFSSNSTAKLNQSTTQKFMKYIQKAQPQVRFLELGTAEQFVKEVGRQRLDLEAIKAAGKKYGVSSIFTGTYELSDVKPKLDLKSGFSSINASAVVNITVVSKHWDTATGATAWTNSRHGQWSVAKVKKDSKTPVSLSLSDPEDKYEGYIEDLVFAVVDDFRPHYEQRKAPK